MLNTKNGYSQNMQSSNWDQDFTYKCGNSGILGDLRLHADMLKKLIGPYAQRVSPD